MKRDLKPENIEMTLHGDESLSDLWDKFAASAIPEHASDEKINVVKNAFYNGIYLGIMTLGGCPETPKDLSFLLARLKTVCDEVNQYYSSINKKN